MDVLITGGGISPPADAAALAEQGLGKLFGPGTDTSDVVDYIRGDVESCFTTVVVLTPESGDGIQTMKAGPMEIGDRFAINGTDREGAPGLANELEASSMRGGALDGRARARARAGSRHRHGGADRLRGAGRGADAGCCADARRAAGAAGGLVVALASRHCTQSVFRYR